VHADGDGTAAFDVRFLEEHHPALTERLGRADRGRRPRASAAHHDNIGFELDHFAVHAGPRYAGTVPPAPNLPCALESHRTRACPRGEKARLLPQQHGVLLACCSGNNRAGPTTAEAGEIRAAAPLARGLHSGRLESLPMTHRPE